ncbi:FkbM family methyltransferase [Methylovirgula sp. 4M-Z18]|uniref:FkbM family methyltransferase n=1 Tax=Methylovirgula sp. 4M-Z18 TaxID=2293567 RepID=UPI000E2FD4B7|nr:FkbM family methyltransferase [Methylovirgula sp. 4M-Z18]RFB80995.1 FkbM family methyltransferase [Methylovirgula sp. 4M-Z18]
MAMISYAQNHEDILLWRALKHIDAGFYVDVGANDPQEDSVTKLFYDRGWRGINIEPVSEYFTRLQSERPRDINLQVAVGAEDGSGSFYETKTRGWATSDRTIGEEYVQKGEALKVEVERRSLDSIFGQCNPPAIHFLKIDVEGAEKEVLAGLDFQRFRPWIIVVEALDPIDHRDRSQEWEAAILAGGYDKVYFDGLNRYYLAAEHSDLRPAFAAQPNVLDGFRRASEVWQEEALIKHHAVIQAQADALAQAERQLAEAEAKHARESEQQAKSRDDALRRATRYAEQVRELRRTILARDVALAQMQQRANEAEANYQGVLSSNFWRATAPLRRLVETSPPGTRLYARRGVKAAWWAVTPWRIPARLRFIQERNAAETKLRADQEKSRPIAARPDTVDVEILPAEPYATPRPKGKRTLYVFVDHTVRCDVNTGIQRVARGLAAGLMQIGERVRFVKWDWALQRCVFLDQDERDDFARWNGPEVTGDEDDIYPPAGAPAVPVPRTSYGANNWLIVPEVTHMTPHPQPLTDRLIQWARTFGLRSSFVFHDAIPLRRLELEHVAGIHRKYMQDLRKADVIWPNSDWSKADLLSFWATRGDEADQVIPEVTTFPLPGGSSRRARITEIAPSDPLILSVGSIEPRKNQLALVRAFQTYRRAHPESPWRLQLVGNLHPDVHAEIMRAQAEDAAISYLGHISDEELDHLYRTCAFTAFPSLEEGFGLPILESLWYAKPCVCADFGAMAEVAREGGCLMVDVRDEARLHDALVSLIDTPELRHKLEVAAITRPISSWADYARLASARLDREEHPLAALGPIYFWMDGTVDFPKNTGIQRVARQLARNLMDLGAKVIAVKWDKKAGQLQPVSDEEYEFLAHWNGPAPEQWHEWIEPEPRDSRGWFIMPELPLHLSTMEQEHVLTYVHDHGLKAMAVFYDAIPWKMREIYPEHFSRAHYEYMGVLSGYDLLLSISDFSRRDFIHDLATMSGRSQKARETIKVAVLPGEFAESERVTTIHAKPAGAPLTILSVGTVEHRKNHLAMIEAFLAAKSSSNVPMTLVIAGRDCVPELTEKITHIVAREPSIVWEMHADDVRLRELYDECDYTIYPSVEEGFGLPILESLWFGKPCVCADFGAMVEVARSGGCLTVDVRNPHAIADAIHKMSDDVYRKRLAEEAVTLHFKSWREYSEEVIVRLAQFTPRGFLDEIPLDGAEIERRAREMRV